MKIYIRVGNNNPVFLEKASAKRAEALVESYKRQDRYEIETLKYKMPTHWEGKYPEYILVK